MKYPFYREKMIAMSKDRSSIGEPSPDQLAFAADLGITVTPGTKSWSLSHLIEQEVRRHGAQAFREFQPRVGQVYVYQSEGRILIDAVHLRTYRITGLVLSGAMPHRRTYYMMSLYRWTLETGARAKPTARELVAIAGSEQQITDEMAALYIQSQGNVPAWAARQGLTLSSPPTPMELRAMLDAARAELEQQLR